MMPKALPPFPQTITDDIAITAWCRTVVHSFGFVPLATKLVVCWNPRMRTAAGRAFWPAARIELNPRLLEIRADEVERTVRHELAHLLAHARAGRRRITAHGAEWQAACVDLGIAGEAVCHRLPFERRVMARRYVYHCPYCKKIFPRVRPMKKRSACLACCRTHNGGRYSDRFRLLLGKP